MSHSRQGATVVGLAWNLSSGLLQPLGLTQSIGRIGPKAVGCGIAQFVGSAARMESVVKDVHERSEFMRLRGKTLNRELGEIRDRVKGKVSAIEASFFYLIVKLQMVADIPTWLGAYHQAVEQGNDDARAVVLADQAVLDTQGGGATAHLAGIQRHSAAKAVHEFPQLLQHELQPVRRSRCAHEVYGSAQRRPLGSGR